MKLFTVTQKTGLNSTVAVRREDTVDFMGKPVSTLYFNSNQYLDTGSSRAWKVNEAISKYCRERGYQVARQPTGRNTTQAVYDQRAHGSVIAHGIFEQIKADERFVAVVEDAQRDADETNTKYAPVIARLKHLVFELEWRQKEELDKARSKIKESQAEIAAEIGVPDEIDKLNRKRLLAPYHPVVNIERESPQSDHLPDLERVAQLMSEL